MRSKVSRVNRIVLCPPWRGARRNIVGSASARRGCEGHASAGSAGIEKSAVIAERCMYRCSRHFVFRIRN